MAWTSGNRFSDKDMRHPPMAFGRPRKEAAGATRWERAICGKSAWRAGRGDVAIGPPAAIVRAPFQRQDRTVSKTAVNSVPYRGSSMFVTPAFAQTGPLGGDTFGMLIPFVLIIVMMYFLILRPQQK